MERVDNERFSQILPGVHCEMDNEMDKQMDNFFRHFSVPPVVSFLRKHENQVR